MKSPKNDKLNFSFLFLPLFNRGNRNGLAYPNEFLRKMVFFSAKIFPSFKNLFPSSNFGERNSIGINHVFDSAEKGIHSMKNGEKRIPQSEKLEERIRWQ